MTLVLALFFCDFGYVFLFLGIFQKLAVGGLPEKILTAYQSVLEDNPNEDTALNKCNAAVQHLIKIGEDVGSSLAQGMSFLWDLMLYAYILLRFYLPIKREEYYLSPSLCSYRVYVSRLILVFT